MTIRSTGRRLSSALLICLALGSHPARAENERLLEAEDVIEMVVVGVPELSRRATLDTDGKLSLPLFGDVDAAGLTLPELRARLRNLMPSLTYRQKTGAARDQMVGFVGSDLLIEVVETRPVYVTGDVSTPGEQTYRAGLTVRQIIALAGGYRRANSEQNGLFLQNEDLRTEYRTLWADYAATQARIWRLEAMLDGRRTLSSDEMPGVPEEDVVAQAIQAETSRLKNEADQFEHDKANLASRVVDISKQVDELREQSRIQYLEVASAEKELAEINDSFDKRLVVSPRVTEARRTLLASSSLNIQIRVEVLRAQTQLEDLRRQQVDIVANRLSRLRSDLSDAKQSLQTIRMRLQASGQKLAYASTNRVTIEPRTTRAPQIVIHRYGATAEDTPSADLDTKLFPGDVLEVNILPSDPLGDLRSPSSLSDTSPPPAKESALRP